MKTIAVDAHSANCAFAIFSSRGELGKCLDRPTSARNLIEVIESVSGPRQLIVEESHMAEWIKRTAERHVDRLIVCDPRRNHWIAKDEFNDDTNSAIKLGKLLLGGFIKEIHHPETGGAELRSLFLHYYDLNEQLTRFKNKLKAVFRSEAIATAGKGIYDEEEHAGWLKQLKGLSHREHTARHLFELVDEFERLKRETFEAMTKRARKERAYSLLEEMPGAGPVVVTGYVALLETPHRFSRRNKLWKYAGLGQVRHISDEGVYADHASSSGNRVLKWVVFTHFQGAVERMKKPNRFRLKFQALRGRGLGYSTARRHVCRGLLSSAWAIWRKEEAYRDDPLSSSR